MYILVSLYCAAGIIDWLASNKCMYMCTML